jgi:hypothetical protein
MAQTPAPKQILYKVEVLDESGSISKPIIRTLEKQAAEIDVNSTNREFKIKLTPGSIDGNQISNTMKVTLDTSLLDKDGKSIGKNERMIILETKLALGKTTVWDITEKGAVAVKMPKSHKAPKGEILVSINVDVPKDTP